VMKIGFCSATSLSVSAVSPLCHPHRSAAQWRDLRFPPIARPLLRAITTLPFVISTEAQRSGEISVWMLFLEVFSGRPGPVRA
jgi:hypothetical protein